MESLETELESVRQMGSLRDREISFVKTEIDKDERALSQMHAYILAANDQLSKTNDRIAALQLALGVSNEEVAELQQRLYAATSDEESVAEYIHSDSLKVKELRRKVQDMDAELSKRKEQLASMEEAEILARLELDGELQHLRELTKSKQEKSHILQSKLSAIQEADGRIEDLSSEYGFVLNRIQRKSAKLTSLKDSVEEAKKEEQWYAKEIAETSKSIANARDRIIASQRSKDEEHLLLAQALSDRTQSERELLARQSRLDRYIKDVEITKSKLALLEQKVISEQFRGDAILSGKIAKETEAVEARKVLEEVLGQLGESETTVNALKAQIIDETTIIADLKQKLKTAVLEISGASTALTQVKKRIQRLTDSEETLREQSNSLQLEIEKVNYKLGSLVGHVSSNEERDRLLSQLRELESQLKEVRAVQTLLSNESKQLEVVIKRTDRESESVRLDLMAVESHQHELEVEVNAIERESKSIDSEFNKHLLARDELTARMANKRTELETTINRYIAMKTESSEKEKNDEKLKLEIIAEGEKFQQIYRELHEQKHFLAVKAGDLKGKIAQLQTQYDHLVKIRMGTDEDDIHSQAHAVVKAAQERQAMADEAEKVAKQLEDCKEEIMVLEAALVSMQRGGKRSEWEDLEIRVREFEKKILNLDQESAQTATLEFVTSNIETLKRIVRDNSSSF